jgi:hypothetical protein
MSWADFKAVRGIVVNLPASQRAIIHRLRARAYEELREAGERLSRPSISDTDVIIYKAQKIRALEMMVHFVDKWPSRSTEAHLIKGIMQRDARYKADRAGGMSQRQAREKWKSRMRSTRHTAALQAWDVTRRVSNRSPEPERKRQRVVATAPHIEEDPRNASALLEEAPAEYSQQQRTAWQRGGHRAAAVDAPWRDKGGSFHEVGVDVVSRKRRTRSEEQQQNAERRHKRREHKKSAKKSGGSGPSSSKKQDVQPSESESSSTGLKRAIQLVDNAGRLTNAAARNTEDNRRTEGKVGGHGFKLEPWQEASRPDKVKPSKKALGKVLPKAVATGLVKSTLKMAIDMTEL